MDLQCHGTLHLVCNPPPTLCPSATAPCDNVISRHPAVISVAASDAQDQATAFGPRDSPCIDVRELQGGWCVCADTHANKGDWGPDGCHWHSRAAPRVYQCLRQQSMENPTSMLNDARRHGRPVGDWAQALWAPTPGAPPTMRASSTGTRQQRFNFQDPFALEPRAGVACAWCCLRHVAQHHNCAASCKRAVHPHGAREGCSPSRVPLCSGCPHQDTRLFLTLQGHGGCCSGSRRCSAIPAAASRRFTD